MKCKIIFYFLLCATALQIAFTQETHEGQPILESSMPEVILTNPKYFSKDKYQTLDGTPLPYKEVLKLAGTVPQNAFLLKEEKGWAIANWSTLGLFVASLATAYIYSEPSKNLPHREIMWPVGVYTAAASFLGTIICGQIRNIKLQRMVDNYNITIMGVSIN
jgi:hypothetical protein